MAPRAKKVTVVKPGRGLARPGDPLVTGKGETIEPINKPEKKKGASELITPQTIDPAQYRPTKKRVLKELPAEARVITAVGAVFMYTLLGVGDREIADTLNTSVDDVIALRNHSAYGECFQIIHGEFINANSDLLTSRIAAYSQTALQTVGDLVQTGKKEEVRLRASIDMLDRAGVRPKDQEQRQSSMTNDLRIIIIDGNAKNDIEIEINGEM